jgi:transposase
MTPAPDPTTDPAALRAENARLRATVDELLAAVAQLRNTVAKQQAHIDRLVRLTFGRRSERLAGPTLFDGVAGPDPVVANPPPSPPTDAPVSPPRRRGHGRRPHPADLPRERVEVDLTEAEKACPCCGERRVRIGTDVSERLDYRPASLFVRQVARATYACRHCERRGVDPHVIRPPLPAEPIPRGAVAAGLLAHVIVAKFCDHLPLYRQESILGRLGWEVSRSTLCDHLRACAAVLRPLYRLMIDRVKQSYAGYNPVHGDGRRHVGCWMHARRGFFDARDSDVRSIEALARIRTLYAVERRAKELALTDDARAAYRREHARPILDAFADWLADERRTALPKSAFGQAVHYAINQWPGLTRYVGDSRLAIDNSPAEQAIRPLAVGRANWLHIGGDTGLSSAAVLVSVTASAKRHHVNPWAYLRDVLIAIPARGPNAYLSDLLPDAWRRSHADPLPVTAG